jgi:cystine transport system ATP-binding protein
MSGRAEIMAMIEAQGLTKRYGDREVLRGVDFAVEEGEVAAVIGPSGSGKTTLLRCLACLEAPSGGVIRVGSARIEGGLPLARQKPQIAILRRSVGFVFQSFNLFPHRTAIQNVIEGPVVVRGQPKGEAEARGRALLAKVGLAERADAYPSELSGGQQQRVAIARALALDPAIILFDEPTSALDPELVGEVLASIRDLAAERRTMVIVTHEMAFAREVADRTVFMDGGKIVEQGPSKALFAAPVHERTRRFLAELKRED